MNKYCKELGLNVTKFGNPHGLPHPDSKSNAIEVARLCSYMLNDPLFCRIVNTKEYTCTIYNFKGMKR